MSNIVICEKKIHTAWSAEGNLLLNLDDNFVINAIRATLITTIRFRLNLRLDGGAEGRIDTFFRQ